MNNDTPQFIAELDPLVDSRGFRWWTLIVPFLILTFIYGCYAMVNGDIWWHLKTGEWILNKHRVPTQNLFTYTNPTSPWIDLHWGFQTLVAIIFHQFGTFGLVVAKSFIAVATFLLLLLTSRNSLPAWVTVICWAPFLAIFSSRYHVRPEMFSLLFVACTLWLLHYSSHRPWSLWLLVPLQIVWVNMQGLFVLQHVIVGAFLLHQLLSFALERRENQLLRRLILVSVVSLMSSLINPYGLQGALFPLELLGKMSGDLRVFYQSLAGETLGITEFVDRYGLIAITRNSTTLLLFVTAFFVVVSQLASTIYRRRIDLYHWVLIVGFGYLAWKMNRNSNLYALVYGYLLCCNAANIISFYRLAGQGVVSQQSRSQQLVPNYLALSLQVTILLAVLGVLAITINDALNHRDQNPGQQPERTYLTRQHEWYNHAAAHFINKIPAPMNVYARHQGTGFAGVVIYHCFDESSPFCKRVYADARLEANTVRVLRDFEAIPKLLETDFPAAEALLIDEQGELPLLVFGNDELISRPRLLQALTESDKWQSIFVSEFNRQSRDLGVTIFMTNNKRQAINLPRVSVEPVLDAAKLFRQ